MRFLRSTPGFVVAHENQFVLNVILPDGLKTSYNKMLEFKQEMQGSAEIVTEELRLLEWILYPLKYLLSSSL